MAIGITYTGTDGLTSAFSAAGANEAMENLRRLQERSMAEAQSLAAKRKASFSSGGGGGGGITNEQYHANKEARAQEQAAKAEARRLGIGFKDYQKLFGTDGAGGGAGRANLQKFIGMNASVEIKNGKLQLKGDSPFVKAGMFYGTDRNGKRGFHSLDDVDPRVKGAVIGSALSTDAEAQGDKRDADDKGPFEIGFVTRIFIANTGVLQSLNACVRTISFTGEGRAYAIGEETMMWVCDINNFPRPFDIDIDEDTKQTKVVRCKVYCADQLATCLDTEISNDGGSVYLHINRNSSQYTISVSESPGDPSSAHVSFMLYERLDGNIVCDLRPNGPIPVFKL